MSEPNTEWLLFQEAARDLEMESGGITPPIGEMQRRFPEEYKTARELVLILAPAVGTGLLSYKQAEKISEMLHSEEEGLSSIQDVMNMQPVNALTLAFLIRLERKHTGKKAVEARHSRSGGSREKKDMIREIWSSGKYSTRDICAEQECAGLGMSYDTARKALRRTPNPKVTSSG